MNISEYKVLHSNAGYYIGRTCEDEVDGMVFDVPYDRLSGYYKTEAEAQQALRFEQLHA